MHPVPPGVRGAAFAKGVEEYFSDRETRRASCQASWIKSWPGILLRSSTLDADFCDPATASQTGSVRRSVARNRLFIFIQRGPDIAESSRNIARRAKFG